MAYAEAHPALDGVAAIGDQVVSGQAVKTLSSGRRERMDAVARMAGVGINRLQGGGEEGAPATCRGGLQWVTQKAAGSGRAKRDSGRGFMIEVEENKFTEHRTWKGEGRALHGDRSRSGGLPIGVNEGRRSWGVGRRGGQGEKRVGKGMVAAGGRGGAASGVGELITSPQSNSLAFSSSLLERAHFAQDWLADFANLS